MMAHFIQLAWAIGAVAIVAIACWGIGGCFQRSLREGGSLLDSECAALRFLGGAGLLGLITFLVGQIHFAVWICVAILLIAASLSLRFPWMGRRWTSVSPALIYAGVIVALCVIGGLAKPIGHTDADEISYHLLGPPIWLREHRIAPVPEESLTAFPATIEMLYGLATVISNDNAPGALGALFLGVLAFQVRGLARRLGSSVAGGDLAAAFVAGMPAVTSTVDHCFVDVPYAAFILASARLAFEGSQSRHAMLAGIFAGFATGTKYFGLPATLLIAFLVLVFHGGRLAPRLWNGMVFLIAAGVAGGAWYVRNWIVLGSPIYPPPPSLWHWFPTPTFSLESSVQLNTLIVERGAGFGRKVSDLLLLPFRLTYWTASFHGGGGMGLAPLAFGPLALALVWKKRVGLAWVALGVMLTIFWFYSDQEFRFLGPAAAIYAAFAGVGAGALLQPSNALFRWPAFAVIGISLAIGGFHAVTNRADRLRAAFSPARAELRFREGVPYREAFEYLNARVDVRKVFVCEPFTPVFYLQKPYTVARGRFGEQPRPEIHSVKDAIGAVRYLGITHVLDVNYYDAGFTWPTTGAGRLVYEGVNVRIFECGEVVGR